MNQQHLSVSGRRSLFIWGLFCVIAGVIFLTYTLASLAVGRGEFVMPLDDVYIHFQYARQLAAGQPYVYNPGLPPSSGATSFLYPYILAFGYLIGFQGLNLGLWAMGVGALALVGCMWLVYKLTKIYAPEWLAVGVALIFAVSGAVSWHFMSGMETGLVVLFSLGTVYALTPNPSPSSHRDASQGRGEQRRFRDIIIWATLMALIRPEGAVLTVLAVLAVVIAEGSKPSSSEMQKPLEGVVRRVLSAISRRLRNRSFRWLLIPIVAIVVQPMVNLVLTGSAVASGNAAKSVFGMIPFSWGGVIRRVLDNFGRMWAEFFTGSSPREGMYILPLMLVLAVIGIGFLLARRESRLVGLVVIGWLVGGTLLIATLDTAFWHFKRYQMPFMALLFPMGAWGGEVLSSQFLVLSSKTKQISLLIAAVLLSVVTVGTAGQFLRYYALNVDYVYLQPLQMARWLQANTPPNAVVAVHDTGMMRYMGGRTTIDMVGLTTAGAADYWRNGPGSVAEYLMEKRPDYIASYGSGHGFGLGMIADTSIYGEPLASFPVQLDNNANVALAADFQGIYKPDWSTVHHMGYIHQQSICDNYFIDCSRNYHGLALTITSAQINVADLTSEKEINYRWQNVGELIGFPTEVHEFDYVGCYGETCNVVDGGRLINGEESFDYYYGFQNDGGGYLLVTRLHPANAGTFDVYVDDQFIATRWIPEIKGQWLEIPTLIRSAFVPNDTSSSGYTQSRIRIIPHVANGYYMPYQHTFIYYTADRIAPKSDNQLSTFQDGAIVLSKADIGYDADTSQATINFEWYTDGSAQGDYKLFVHVYSDVNQPPVAQTDGYPGGGTLPPGDWLPGVLRDTITVDLTNIPAGKYQVAIGLYNPYTNERLQPTSGDDQGRLFIGEIEIK